MQVAQPKAASPGLRVLQVGPLYVNQVRRWSEHAAALGHSVWAAGHVRPERQLVELSGVAEEVEVEPVELQRLGTAARVKWLRRLIRRLEPDLVHAHYLTTWGCYATLADSRPVIVTPWGSDLYLAAGDWRRNADRALREAGLVVARSRHMCRELLARGVAAERICELDLGVDLARFRPPSTPKRDRVRRDLGLPAGPVILSARAGTPLYNLDVVVEAFRIVRERLRDATLLIVHGGAPLSAALRSSLDGMGREDGVRVIGDVSHAEMPTYLSAATAGVSIPSSDGSPSSVWEALSSGVPMVLSNLPQVEERVAASGAVRAVEPAPEAVASALLEIATDAQLHAEMAGAGRAWVEANADHRDQVARLGEVYTATTTGSGASTARPHAAARIALRPEAQGSGSPAATAARH